MKPKLSKPASPALRARLRPAGLASTPVRRGEPVDFGEIRTAPAKLPETTADPAKFTGPTALSYVHQHVPGSAIRVEPGPPAKMSAGHISRLEETLAAGAQILQAQPEPDQLGYLVGFDFGTSSSKIVIHQPGAGDHAYALPVPQELQVSEQGRLQQHLWRSTVWFHPQSQRFGLTPQPGAIAIEGFKTGLINSLGLRMAVPGVTHAQAATAYLALLLAYVIGQHRREAPLGFDRRQHYARFHFGVPVACKEELGCIDGFLRVLAAAFEIAPYAAEIDLTLVRAALAEADPRAPITSETPFLVFEELAAVIAGYKASPERKHGPHMVIDVGASTLDVATFHIPEGDYAVPVYMSGVALLGAEALTAARRNDVPDPTFRAACAEHTKHVWSTTFRLKNPSFLPSNGVAKPLLFVGGGRNTHLHAELFKRYEHGFESRLCTPKPGRNLRCDRGTDFARLLLAWGLSQEDVRLPEIRPPSQVEAQARGARDWQARFVDKDMV